MILDLVMCQPSRRQVGAKFVTLDLGSLFVERMGGFSFWGKVSLVGKDEGMVDTDWEWVVMVDAGWRWMVKWVMGAVRCRFFWME